MDGDDFYSFDANELPVVPEPSMTPPPPDCSVVDSKDGSWTTSCAVISAGSTTPQSKPAAVRKTAAELREQNIKAGKAYRQKVKDHRASLEKEVADLEVENSELLSRIAEAESEQNVLKELFLTLSRATVMITTAQKQQH